MLTEANVKHFLENVLEFENWSTVLSDSKHNFLSKIVSKFGTHLHYEVNKLLCDRKASKTDPLRNSMNKFNSFEQNITWGAMETSERKLPKVPDIISHTIDTHGGACVHLNYFLKLLLDFLGFRVDIFSSEVLANGLPNNHLVLVVQIDSVLTASGDRFLVDVGMGRPITCPINLNDLPHRSRAGGFDFEVRFNEQSLMHERILYAGCAIKGELEPQTYKIVEVTYDLQKPKQLSDFDEEFTIIFTDRTDYFFCNTIFLYKFVSIKTATEFEFVSFRGRTFVHGSRDNRTERKFETYVEMADVIMSWFPKINEFILRKALSNYDLKRLSKAATKS